MAIGYNTTYNAFSYIFTASGGGTVFSADLHASSAFDLFTDTAVVGDAIYFATSIYYTPTSDIQINIGTAMVGGKTLVWEYYRQTVGWTPIVQLTDPTNGFTVTGANTITYPLQPLLLYTTVNGVATCGWHRVRIASVVYTTGAFVFTGTGLNDATASGTYTGTENSQTFTIVIDSVGATDTFKWKKGAGAWTTGVAITGGLQTLSDGVKVTFAAVTGHTLNDQWVTTITSITEGGRTQTTFIKTSDGYLRTGSTYTDGAPCRWETLYQWCLTNAPQIQATKSGYALTGAIYTFPNCAIITASRLTSTRENVFIGNGHPRTYFDASYLQSGVLEGTYTASSICNYYICANLGTSSFNGGANTKVYGGSVQPVAWTDAIGTYDVQGGVNFGNGTYVQFQAIMSFEGYISGTASIKNVVCKGEFTTTSFPTLSTALDQVYIYGGMISLYTNVNGTFQNLNIANYSIYSKINSAIYSTNQKIYFINPIVALPTQTTSRATSMVDRNWATPATAIGSCFYYDDSAGTYTDYTTQANDATLSDVPLTGDVGDIYYFRVTGMAANEAPVLRFIHSNVSNDYVYKWQLWLNRTPAAWVDCEYVWDETYNFTVSAKYVYIKPNVAYGTDGSQNNWSLSKVINGATGYWVRLIITSKGAATPSFSRVYSGLETHVSDWMMYQQYTVDLTVRDTSGNLLDGVQVVCKNLQGTTQFTANTVTGVLAQQTLTQRVWFFDPLNSPLNWGKCASTDYSPFTFYLTKTGYESVKLPMDITNKVTFTISMKPIIPLRQTFEGELLLANQPELGSSSKLLQI